MGKPSFTIRLMTEDDISSVLKIERSVFSDPWQEEIFYNEIDIDGSYVIEDTEKQKICGYLCGMHILNEYSLQNIAIAKDYQNKGLGKLLLKSILQRNIESGYYNCYLEVRKSNCKAITFFKKYGFDIVHIKKEYYQNPQEDALIMKFLSLKKE